MPSTKSLLVAAIVSCLFPIAVLAQSKTNPVDKFAQMDDLLPTPNEQRTASGAPGNRYWQQRADYDIKVDARRRQPAAERLRNNHLPEQLARSAFISLAATRSEHLGEGLGRGSRPRRRLTSSNIPFSTIEALIAEA